MLRKLYDWSLRMAASPQAEKVLGAMSFAESSFFPIPADVVFVPMCLARRDKVWRYALVASVTSVLGGIFGWFIGHYFFELLARPLLEFYGKMPAFEALKAATGAEMILLLLVTSGFSHLPPMKVVTILSGVVSFSLPLFILSAIVARGGRFYLLAFVLHRYGEPMARFIERRMTAVLAVLLALAALAWLGTKYL